VPCYGVNSKRKKVTIMADKALISELTWRSLEMQKKAFPDMPHFVAPHEIDIMLRKTTRKVKDTIHMMSLGIVAKTEKDFLVVAKLLNARGVAVVCLDDDRVSGGHKLKDWRCAWRRSRRTGAAKKGGEAKAEKDEQKFWEGFNKISDRWHLPSKGENISSILLKEADTSRNTARSYLGYTREEWQQLSQPKRDRILKRKKHAKQ
jgi:hypothetical protein